MATPSLVSAQNQAHRGTVSVVIGVDKQGNIVVEPDTFWVSKSAKQEVKWFCSIGHNHEEHKPCFKVDFNGAKGSPFEKWHFEDNPAPSGPVPEHVPSGERLYKYTVTVGTQRKDPTGGVEP